jgi:putative membrane protein
MRPPLAGWTSPGAVINLLRMFVLAHLALLAATILVLSRVLPSVRIQSAGTAIVVAITFSVLNFFLGWLIRTLLIVPAIFTLGLLFFFVPLIVNAVLLWATDKLLASFEITSARGLLISAFAITVVNWLFYAPHFQAISVDRLGAAPTWI